MKQGNRRRLDGLERAARPTPDEPTDAYTDAGRRHSWQCLAAALGLDVDAETMLAGLQAGLERVEVDNETND